MGQSRYERLPKTQNWQSVVAILATPDRTVVRVATATVKACRAALKRHSSDPVLGSSLFLLVRLPLAAKQGQTPQFMKDTGLDPESFSSFVRLLDEISGFFQRQNLRNPDPSFMTEISAYAFDETISKLMSESNLDLFADSAGQIERTLADFGTPRGFARAARIFFTSFMSRVLAYFLSKETVNHVGRAERFEALTASQDFLGELRRYCWESSEIIDSFAEEWYSKYKWQDKLDLQHIATFAWASLRKLSAEIGREHDLL